MTYSSVCATCGKSFQSQKSESTICYSCALERLAGNNAPEEGDFNSARIVSGEMTDQEVRWLQEDLESLDHSKEESYERDLYEDNDDYGRWDYLEERDDE